MHFFTFYVSMMCVRLQLTIMSQRVTAGKDLDSMPTGSTSEKVFLSLLLVSPWFDPKGAQLCTQAG